MNVIRTIHARILPYELPPPLGESFKPYFEAVSNFWCITARWLANSCQAAVLRRARPNESCFTRTNKIGRVPVVPEKLAAPFPRESSIVTSGGGSRLGSSTSIVSIPQTSERIYVDRRSLLREQCITKVLERREPQQGPNLGWPCANVKLAKDTRGSQLDAVGFFDNERLRGGLVIGFETVGSLRKQ